MNAAWYAAAACPRAVRFTHTARGKPTASVSDRAPGLTGWAFARLAIACVGLFVPSLLAAHSFFPIQVLLRELSPNLWLVQWSYGPLATLPRISLLLPEGCNPREIDFPNSSRVSCSAPGLAEATLRFVQREPSAAELWVRAEFFDGKPVAGPVPAERLEFWLFHPERLPLARIVPLYVRLGIGHILEGWDHLLFLFGLLLGVTRLAAVAGAVTAFTAAHTLSLAATSVRVLHFSQPIVEILIALSIVLVARERMREGTLTSASYRRTVALAFAFGLVHGLGFSGALRELGVPQQSLLWALAAFNVGVEVGQLGFVIALLPLLALWQRAAAGRALLGRFPAFAVGVAGAYWTLTRAVALWSS